MMLPSVVQTQKAHYESADAEVVFVHPKLVYREITKEIASVCPVTFLKKSIFA